MSWTHLTGDVKPPEALTSSSQPLMEPINPRCTDDHAEANFDSYLLSSVGSPNTHFLEENDSQMSFLQMLHSVGLPPCFPSKEPNFESLQKLQHVEKPPWEEACPSSNIFASEPQQVPLEFESCVTSSLDMIDVLNSSVKLETGGSRDCAVNLPSECSEVPPTSRHQLAEDDESVFKEKRNRKRTKVARNKEEEENQRMIHIAVERKRRRLMNEYLSSLRALMPPSYVQRGDQASIVGGAIDFVKELEQLMQTLEVKRRLRIEREKESVAISAAFSPSLSLFHPVNTSWAGDVLEGVGKVRHSSETAEIDVTKVKDHVNVRVHCDKRPSQLLRAVLAMEELKLTILHLNITSTRSGILYTFNLKIEEACPVRSADEVAGVVHRIFSFINGDYT